jgi:hypothetical protein
MATKPKPTVPRTIRGSRRAGLYLALRRLDDAITEVQAALHTSSASRQRNSI